MIQQNQLTIFVGNVEKFEELNSTVEIKKLHFHMRKVKTVFNHKNCLKEVNNGQQHL